MKLRVLYFLIWIPAFFQFSDHAVDRPQAEKEGEIIYLEKANSRHLLFPESDLIKVKVCNLTEGKNYFFTVTQEGGCQPLISADRKAKTAKEPMFAFQAEAACREVVVHANYEAGCTLPIYFTATCPDCTDKSAKAPSNSQKVLAPIVTSPAFTPQQLVQDVFIGGGCFATSNITFLGSTIARGTFSSGTTSVGLSDGVILSTGNIATATGPNNQTGAGGASGGGSDPDLSQIAGGIAINDAAILRFDFEPTEPQVTFRYVFASEEYCDYVNSPFNDAFGFFLSGPGINGPYSGQAINIATLPNGTAVAINSVNHQTNPGFYVGNIPAGDPQLNDPDCAGHPIAAGQTVQDCQYDGWTTILTAVANVIPCETYSIKLAVGDGGDNAFDSAVFLEANSFAAGGTAEVIASVPVTQSGDAYEGCGDAYFVFNRSGGDPSQPLVINFTVGGTATAGVDYNSTITTGSITIPPFQNSVQIPVFIINDLITEGAESIILTLEDPCNCTNAVGMMFILDKPPLMVDIQGQTVCQGLPVQIQPTVSGGVPPYTYQWSNGSQAPMYIAQPQQSGTVSLTVTDACGQTAMATANITVYQMTANITGTADICPGSGDTGNLTVTFTGPGPWNLTYLINGMGPYTINGITQSPYTLVATQPGVYTVLAVVQQNGCFGMGTGQGVITTSEVDFASAVTAVSCFGESDGAIDLTVSGGATPYDFDWSNGATVEDPLNLAAGDYTVVVTDANGCESDTTITINEPGEVAIAVDNVVGVDCDNPTGGSIGITPTGGTPGYTYQWSNGDTIQNPVDLAAGSYQVIVTDANGCTSSASANVPGDVNIPTADIQVAGVVDCSNSAITLDGSASSSGPAFTYQWSVTGGGAITSATDAVVIAADGGGTYQLTVTDTINGCFSITSVIVTEDTQTPSAVANAPNLLTCNDSEVGINSNGSSSGADISYAWSTPDGNFVSSPTQANPVVDAPGTYILLVTDAANGCSSSDTVTVLEDVAIPTADAGPDGTIDCIVTSLQLDGSASSSGGNFAYEWTTADGNIVGDNTVLTPEIDQEGTYVLTVTNLDNGCVATAQSTVLDASEDPTVDIQVPAPITCVDLTSMLDGSGSSSGAEFSYQWSVVSGGNNIVAGDTTPMATVDGPGTYALLVTNNTNGCTASQEITVDLDQATPVADAGMPATISCTTTTAQLDGSGSSTGSNFSYQWVVVGSGNILSGADTPMPVVDEPGTYQLTVTNLDNGCSASATVTALDDSDSPIAQTTVQGELNCAVEQITINGAGSSVGADFAYQWTTTDGLIINGDNSLFLTVGAAGTYTLEVTNTTNGCVEVADATVTIDTLAPQVDAGPTATLTCATTSLQLDGSGSDQGPEYSYQWTTADGNIVGDNTVLTPEIDQPGTYELVVTNQDNQCVASSTVTIDQNVVEPTAQVETPQQLDCAVTSLQLDASASSGGPDITYAWTTADGSILSGDDTDTPTIDAPGTYELTVLDNANGCSTITTVTVAEDVTPPVADAGLTEVLTCAIPELSLDGSASSAGQNFTYQWTTADGNIVSGANSTAPMVDAPGTYELLVTNTDNNCTATALVTIAEDVAAPTADAGPTFELDCSSTAISLDGSGSSSGPNITYTWTTADGAILSGADTPSPTVNAPGLYELTVLNSQNGCSSTAQVAITQDANAPVAQAEVVGQLTCAVTELPLDGSGSSQVGNYSYQWTTTDGNIVSGATTLSPTVDQPGTYQLLVVDLDNNCQTTTTVEVAEDVTPPDVVAASLSAITCSDPVVSLSGTGTSQGPEYSYQWTTIDGNIVAGGTGLTPQVDQPGTYVLEVTNQQNGCTMTASTLVLEDTQDPIAVIAAPELLTCGLTQFSLDGSGSSTGANFAYQWTTASGQIVTGSTTLAPLIAAPGTYTLQVTNTANGCMATASTDVSEDVQAPVADAGATAELTCAVTDLQLDGSGSDQGPNYSYEWGTANGQIIAGGATLNPTIGAPGQYELTVTNLDNECTATSMVTVTIDDVPPTVAIGDPADLTCIVEEVALNAQGSSSGANYQLQWAAGSGGNIVDQSNPLQPLVDQPGSYTLTITDLSNGCSASLSVAVDENVQEPGADAGTDTELSCVEDNLALDGSVTGGAANVSYLWETTNGNILSGATTASPLVNEPGVYQLTITNNDNGCSSTDEVTVTENEPQAFDWELGPTSCNQENGQIQFGTVIGGKPPYQYSIDGGQTYASQNFFPFLPAGAYDIAVQDANGCVLFDEALIPQSAEVVVDLEETVTVKLGDSYQIEAFANVDPDQIESIVWTPTDGLSCTDCLTPSITPVVNQTYWITITTVDGCEATDRIQLKVDRRPDIYIPNVFSPNGDGENDVFMIFAGQQVAIIRSFHIFDRWGEPVFQLNNFAPNNPDFGWNGLARGKLANPAVYAWFAEIEFIDGQVELYEGDVTLVR